MSRHAHSIQQWTTLLERCFQARLSSQKLGTLASSLRKREPISNQALTSLLVNPSAYLQSGIDPLLPLYIRRLLELNYIDDNHVLRALLHSYTSLTEPSLGISPSPRLQSTLPDAFLELVKKLFEELSVIYATNVQPRSTAGIQQSLETIRVWFVTMSTSQPDAVLQDSLSTVHTLTSQVMILQDCIGFIILSLATNSRTRNFLAHEGNSEAIGDFQKALTALIYILSPISPDVATQLSQLQKTLPVLRTRSSTTGQSIKQVDQEVAGSQLMTKIDDFPINTRAGMYIYLEASLSGLPQTNDITLSTYLQTRYKGDLHNLVVDLVTGVLDLLNATMSRDGTAEPLYRIRWFLVNKVPVLIRSWSATAFAPLDFEFVLSQALIRYDIDLGSTTDFQISIRQEFLLACAMHGVIPEESIERLHGQQPTQGSPSRMTKEGIIMSYGNDVHKVPILLSGVERTDGNAVAFVHAIAHIFGHYCLTKDTISLKTICTSLAYRPSALDSIAMCVAPASLVDKLAKLLDNWKYDDDQGEYQPVYVEFSSCLMLLLSLVDRYQLSAPDIQLIAGESFVGQLLTGGCQAQAAPSLTKQGRHLSGWVRALFETEGISDDLMSSCPPQDFYLIAATLIRQSLVACRIGLLDLDTLMNGLECKFLPHPTPINNSLELTVLTVLLEPFLLPSLLFIVRHLLAHTSAADRDLCLHILHKVVRPHLPPGETAQTHNLILTMLKPALQPFLAAIPADAPTHSTATALREKLDPLSPHRCVTTLSTHDLRAPHGDLAALVRENLAALCAWTGLNATISFPPPLQHSHAALLLSLRLLGAPTILTAIVSELHAQAATGGPPATAVALDVAAALITTEYLTATRALTVNAAPRLTLRAALSLALETGSPRPGAAPSRPLLTLLARRVDAQLAGVANPRAPTSLNAAADVAAPAAADTSDALQGLGLEIDPAAAPLDTDAGLLVVDALAAHTDALTAFADVEIGASEAMDMSDAALPLPLPLPLPMTMDTALAGPATARPAEAASGPTPATAAATFAEALGPIAAEDDIFGGLALDDVDVDFT